MSGIQEILIIVLIVLGILFIPRIIGRPATRPRVITPNRLRLSGLMRLAIAISGLWLLGAVIYHRPWEDITMPFYIYGLGPVIVCWALFWVWDGLIYNKKR